jgi:hypothetical protein
MPCNGKYLKLIAKSDGLLEMDNFMLRIKWYDRNALAWWDGAGRKKNRTGKKSNPVSGLGVV